MAGFRNLIVYQRAIALADDLRQAIQDWPSLDQWTIGVQLIRSADSIGANLAEAFGRGTYRDETRFLLFARGSANETQHWIERAMARSLLTGDSWRMRASEVAKLLNGLYRAQRKRIQTTDD